MADNQTPVQKSKEALKWEKLSAIPGFKELKKEADGRIAFDTWKNFVSEKRKENIFIPLSMYYHQEEGMYEPVAQVVTEPVEKKEEQAAETKKEEREEKQSAPLHAAATKQELGSPEEIFQTIAKEKEQAAAPIVQAPQAPLNVSQKTVAVSEQKPTPSPLQVLLDRNFRDIESQFVVESDRTKIIERIAKRLLLDPKFQYSTEYEKLSMYFKLFQRPQPVPVQKRETEKAEQDLRVSVKQVIQKAPKRDENPIYQQMKEDAFEFGLETSAALEQKSPDEKKRFYDAIGAKDEPEAVKKIEQIVVSAYVAAVPELSVFAQEDEQVAQAVEDIARKTPPPAPPVQAGNKTVEQETPVPALSPLPQQPLSPVVKATQTVSQNIIIAPNFTITPTPVLQPAIPPPPPPAPSPVITRPPAPAETTAARKPQPQQPAQKVQHKIPHQSHPPHLPHPPHEVNVPHDEQTQQSVPKLGGFRRFFSTKATSSSAVPKSSTSGIVGRANSALSLGIRGLGAPRNAFEGVEKTAKNIAGLANPLSPNKWKIIVPIAVAAFFAIFFFFFLENGPGSNTNGTTASNNKPIPNFTITKTSTDPHCDSPHQDQFCVPNPENLTDTKADIHYTITATDPNSYDVTIADSIPNQTVFVSADGNPTCDNGTCNSNSKLLQWNIKNGNATYRVVVHPQTSDILVTNKAIATAQGTGGGFAGGNGCPTAEQIVANRKTTPETCQYFNPSIDIFDTNIPQDGLNNYIAKYGSSYSGGPDAFRQHVNAIVQKSQAAGLNPAILLGYWKSESAFGSSLGCKSSSAPTFDAQIDCALGKTSGGAVVAPCALSHDANSPSCQTLQAVRTKYADLYKKDIIKMPISTFDDFAEAYGSRDPNLSKYEGVTNYNCVHTYNELMDVMLTLNVCKAPVNTSTATGDFAACTFSRGGQSASYQSPKLLGYFQEVAQKTGVPAALLAALVRIESTTGAYSISNYTDGDLSQMENPDNLQKLNDNIDTTIGGTAKALCPTSPTGALGLVQVEPPDILIASLKSSNRAFIPPGAFDEYAVNTGAHFIGKAANNLAIQNYCDPKSSLYIGAGFILGKLKEAGYGDGTKWDPSWNTNRSAINALAKGYYGSLSYSLSGTTFSYGDDLYNGLNSCSVK